MKFKNMATKNIKSVGNILGQTKEYWQNAAKQFVWPIDFEQLHISVPHKDMHLAENDLMVSHFRANGWHIQSAVAVAYTKPFIAPVSDKPIFKPIKKTEIETTATNFKLNDRFKVKSTDCELQICFFDKGKIHLKYTNRNKHNIITSEENLNRVLKMETWVKI